MFTVRTSSLLFACFFRYLVCISGLAPIPKLALGTGNLRWNCWAGFHLLELAPGANSKIKVYVEDRGPSRVKKKFEFRKVFSANADPLGRRRVNVFNGGAATSGRMDKRRPWLDSACQMCLRCMSYEVLTVFVDFSTGGEICWAEFRKSEPGECFQWRSHNQSLYGQREATAGFSMSNMSKVHVSRSSDSSC